MRAARTRRAFRLLHYPVTFVVPLYNALQLNCQFVCGTNHRAQKRHLRVGENSN